MRPETKAYYTLTELSRGSGMSVWRLNRLFAEKGVPIESRARARGVTVESLKAHWYEFWRAYQDALAERAESAVGAA